MILGLQITGILFALMMIYFALLHYKKGTLNGIEIYSWVFVWVLVILIVLFPEIVRTYAASFAITRVLDLLVAGAFILIFVMLSNSYLKINKLDRKFEDLVRKLALKENEKNKTK